MEEVAHEAVVNYREPTQPNPGYNEGFVVRSVRPKGKRCCQKDIECILSLNVTAAFMNDSGKLMDDAKEAIPPRLRYKPREFFQTLAEARFLPGILFRIVGKIDDPGSSLDVAER